MVQSVENNITRPMYNGVKINIKKPEVNAGNGVNTYTDDNGIYNAVSIDIDNPSVNTQPKMIYDYPEATDIVTYDLANLNRYELPQGFNVAYATTNVILPKIANELELEGVEDVAIAEEIEEPSDEVNIPEANYTTTEAEKGVEFAEPTVVGELPEIMDESEDNLVIQEEKISFQADTQPVELKRPEIIPGEEIQPDVDIPLVISNLTNADYDVQAQQMEEIARISMDNPENAVPYIVREVFSNLVDITEKDTKNLAAPTEAQVEARKKMISNFIMAETAKMNNTEAKLPYNLTEKDFVLANELSPMELAERNKEYALYTISILSKVYTDEVEKHTGNVVPLIDLPGATAIVDALRFNPNSGVKIAAIDSLRHIQRPEYKEELTTLFTLAQADSNPQVARVATEALNEINNI